jgi:hypothetical protein
MNLHHDKSCALLDIPALYGYDMDWDVDGIEITLESIRADTGEDLMTGLDQGHIRDIEYELGLIENNIDMINQGGWKGARK